MVVQISKMSMAAAIFITLVANCMHLTSSYIVKSVPETNAGQVLAARSIIQIVVFGAASAWYFCHQRRSKSEVLQVEIKAGLNILPSLHIMIQELSMSP